MFPFSGLSLNAVLLLNYNSLTLYMYININIVESVIVSMIALFLVACVVPK